MQKTSLSIISYISYKKKRCLLNRYAQRLISWFQVKNKSKKLLFLFLLLVIILLAVTLKSFLVFKMYSIPCISRTHLIHFDKNKPFYLHVWNNYRYVVNLALPNSVITAANYEPLPCSWFPKNHCQILGHDNSPTIIFTLGFLCIRINSCIISITSNGENVVLSCLSETDSAL